MRKSGKILQDGSKEGRVAQVGDIVSRGQQIGTIGDANGRWSPHLHFEVRIKKISADNWPIGLTQTQVLNYYIKPSAFISSHRPLVSDPITLSSTNTTSSATTLNWDKPTFPNFDHYELYRSAEQNGTSDPAKRTDLLSGNEIAKNIETISFNDSALIPNTPYYYSLSAFDTNGFSVSSNETTLTTGTGVKNITNNQYNQRFPRINGNYIVWDDERRINGTLTSSLFLYDIEKGEIKVVPVGLLSSSRHAITPAIYDGNVVFEGSSSWAENFTFMTWMHTGVWERYFW